MIKKLSTKSIPTSVWVLGAVSLCMDTSSEMILSLLPVFMMSVLGASTLTIGVVEGVAEATALITKVFSGTLSDYFGKRKFLAMIGYGLAAFTKPLFPLANSMGLVFFARFLDRLGKGIRGAPRDALMSQLAPREIRGASFGLRQALDTVGAFLGPALAVVGMLIFANHVRSVLWLAVLPAVISFFLLAFFVKEPKVEGESSVQKFPLSLRILRGIDPAYWHLVTIAGFMSLARFSQAFLVLRSQATGIPLQYVPLIMIGMNIVYALSAYPAGALSDKIAREKILFVGLVFLIVADIVFGYAGSTWMLALGVTFMGLHLAFSEGLLAAMIADTVPSNLRGTAYGVYNLVCGVALLGSNIMAGFLWSKFGPYATFFTGASCAVVTIIALIAVMIFNGKKK